MVFECENTQMRYDLTSKYAYLYQFLTSEILMDILTDRASIIDIVLVFS